jgi:hypothetical protein
LTTPFCLIWKSSSCIQIKNDTGFGQGACSSPISLKLDNSPDYFEKGLQARIQFTGPVQESTVYFYWISLSGRSAIEKYKQRCVTIYVTLYLETSFGSITF